MDTGTLCIQSTPSGRPVDRAEHAETIPLCESKETCAAHQRQTLYGCIHDGRNEIIYKELPLLQGWNKLVIKLGAGDRNDFTGYFKCDNKKDFLPLLKAAFVNPETK